MAAKVFQPLYFSTKNKIVKKTLMISVNVRLRKTTRVSLQHSVVERAACQILITTSVPHDLLILFGNIKVLPDKKQSDSIRDVFKLPSAGSSSN